LADPKNTTVIHGNHGYLKFNGNVIGRVQNVEFTIDGSMSEFYEMGTAYVQDLEPINRKVNVTIEKGAVNFLLLAFAAGVHTDATNKSYLDDNGNFNLIAKNGGIELVLRDSGAILTTPLNLDVELVATKVLEDGSHGEYSLTAMDCKILRSSVDAPQDDFWTASMELVGKQLVITPASNLPGFDDNAVSIPS